MRKKNSNLHGSEVIYILVSKSRSSFLSHKEQKKHCAKHTDIILSCIA